jgi:hypothetical protein
MFCQVKAKLRHVDRTVVNLTAPDAFFLFEPLHPFRVICRKLVHSRPFAVFTSLLLMYNCACLALERRSIPPEQASMHDDLAVQNLVRALKTL